MKCNNCGTDFFEGVFCPECGYEMKVAKKIFEKHNGGLPTCPCGAKMGIDMEDEEVEEKES